MSGAALPTGRAKLTLALPGALCYYHSGQYQTELYQYIQSTTDAAFAVILM